jgi:hypothetical protein
MLAVADVAYAPDQCTELTFVDYSKQQAAQTPAAAPAPAAKPWWKFWD